MKKSAKLKRKTIRMIVKNLIVLVVLAAVAFTGVRSWFTEDLSASASGITASMKADARLQFYIIQPTDGDQYTSINSMLASTNGAWHEGTISLDPTQNPELSFMSNLFLCDITGDGKSFFIPHLQQYDEVAYVLDSEEFDSAEANSDYLSFDIYFRTRIEDCTVVLKSGSKIWPVNEPSDNSDEEKQNAAIGAVRFSVVNGTNTQLLWIPDPFVYFDGENLHTGLSDFSNKGNKYYDGDSIEQYNEGTNEHAYYWQNSEGTLRERRILSNTTSYLHSSTDTVHKYELGDDIAVVDLDTVDSVNNYYYGHVRVNLWIEGEDPEARLAMVGGKFNISLDFDAQ